MGPEVVGAVVLAPGQVQGPGKIFWIMERKRSSGFRRILTVAFLLFLALRGALTLRGNH